MSFDKELSYVGKSGSATGTPVQGSDDQKINISSSEEKIPPYPDSSSQVKSLRFFRRNTGLLLQMW